MSATKSRVKPRNYKYPFFDPSTSNWNVDTNKIKHFEFVNYLNKSHNRNDTLYLIFEYIPKLNREYILPITIDKNYAVVNDKSKIQIDSIMPQYLAGASQLNDVSVTIFDINKLINTYGEKNFKKMDAYKHQLAKKDDYQKKKAAQIKIKNKNTNKEKNSNTNNNININEKKQEDIKMKTNSDDDIESIETISTSSSNNNTKKSKKINENENDNGNENKNGNGNSICINLCIYNTNTINAIEPKPFASNDFISKIPNYKWHINNVTKQKSNDNLGILQIYNTQKISFRDFKFFNHHTQEFNFSFLINFDKTFVINNPKILREIKQQKRKYSIVKNFINAFAKASIGKTYFFQNGKKLVPFYKKTEKTFVLNWSKEQSIEDLNPKNNIDVSNQYYDTIETYESTIIIFKNQRKNKYLKPNGNEYTNTFILNFGQSIPLDLWMSEGFGNNIVSKLPRGKTYFFETNNAGTKGIPIGLIGENRQNGVKIKFQLNDLQQPFTLLKLKEKYRKSKLDRYIKNNIDFESKRQFIKTD